jgi:hypothetical protein
MRAPNEKPIVWVIWVIDKLNYEVINILYIYSGNVITQQLFRDGNMTQMTHRAKAPERAKTPRMGFMGQHVGHDPNDPCHVAAWPARMLQAINCFGLAQMTHAIWRERSLTRMLVSTHSPGCK